MFKYEPQITGLYKSYESDIPRSQVSPEYSFRTAFSKLGSLSLLDMETGPPKSAGNKIVPSKEEPPSRFKIESNGLQNLPNMDLGHL